MIESKVEQLKNEPYNSWARGVLDIVEGNSWKNTPEVKAFVLKLKTQGLILQNPLPGSDLRNRRFTRSFSDAARTE